MSGAVEGLKRLGMDEIALRKGQGHYVVVLVDLDRKQLIGMVRSRKHEDKCLCRINCILLGLE